MTMSTRNIALENSKTPQTLAPSGSHVILKKKMDDSPEPKKFALLLSC